MSKPCRISAAPTQSTASALATYHGPRSNRDSAMIASDTAGRPAGHVVLLDSPEERFNFDSAFGSLFPDAMRLRAAAGWTGELTASALPPPAGDLTYRLANGTVVLEKAVER